MNSYDVKAPTKEEIVNWFKRNGHPNPDSDWVDEFFCCTDENRRVQFWEAVNNDYDLCDFDRWQHFQNVINCECSWKCFISCSRALWEEDIEILELGHNLRTDEYFRYQVTVEFANKNAFTMETTSQTKPDTTWLLTNLKDFFMESIEPWQYLLVADSIDGIEFTVEDLDGNYIDSDSMEVDDIDDIIYRTKQSIIGRDNASEKFIFADNLYACQDKERQTVEGCLWANNDLVSRMMAVCGYTLRDMADLGIGGIQFYPFYDVKEGTAYIKCLYYTHYDTDISESNLLELSLSDDEEEDLIESFERYSQELYEKDCLTLVNDERSKMGLTKLHPKLENIVSRAALREDAGQKDLAAAHDIDR